MQNIIIIGGGFSGLLVAYLLEKKGLKPRILEARNRLGGRIYTVRLSNEPAIEMGATWLGKKHHHLLQLVNDLDINIYEQYMGKKGYYEPMSVSPPQLVSLPPNDAPSYRIRGGTDQLILSLINKFDHTQIDFNQVVKAIRKTKTLLEVETENKLFKADFVISTLPPKLLIENVKFTPALPNKLTNIAAQTHTWMAESIKVVLTFKDPFWRKPDSSGTIFSNIGPVTEMYDHSGKYHYALKGFMNSAYQSITREQRKQLVIEQLHRFFGSKINNYLSYHELVWPAEPFTYCDYDQPVTPHQYNGHSIFRTTYLDDQLIITGSETAKEFPGYMDGAVESAHRTISQLNQLIRH